VKSILGERPAMSKVSLAARSSVKGQSGLQRAQNPSMSALVSSTQDHTQADRRTLADISGLIPDSSSGLGSHWARIVWLNEGGL